jgi:gamma-glutamylcyclotransferase (GGCT)/AIG2-like uncharacterized protein YtfP
VITISLGGPDAVTLKHDMNNNGLKQDGLTQAALAAVLEAPASHRLFVYGTLLSTADGDYGQVARSRLLRDAPVRLPARTTGQLYELGDYPGLVVPSAAAPSATDASAADMVYGQLLVLADPAVTWPWLDDYEMIATDPAADNEYARVERDITLTGGRAAGTTVRAWVYVYLKPVAGLHRFADGRWQARTKSRFA